MLDAGKLLATPPRARRTERRRASAVANALNSSGDLAQQALSKKESEVLRLFVGGNTVSEIALMLHRSVKTISHQKIAAQQKLGISSDKELYEYAMRNGLL